MRVDVFTIFPEAFAGPLDCSILRRAQDSRSLEVVRHNIRDYTTDRHHVVDDYPYGGGAGMVFKPEPVFAAVESVFAGESVPLLLMTPQGETFHQGLAAELALLPRWAILCGHYEGIDERIREHLVTREISIGDFVLTGGELAAMVIIDAVARLLRGVLGDEESTQCDSFADGLLEHPHYTRPAEFRGWQVPDVLLSGNHAEIARWRRRESLRRTYLRRPELLETVELSKDDRRWLESLRTCKDVPENE